MKSLIILALFCSMAIAMSVMPIQEDEDDSDYSEYSDDEPEVKNFKFW